MNRWIPALLLVSVRAVSTALAGNAEEAHAASDETQTVAIVTRVPQEIPDTRLSRAGLGSLYWAARHPAEAWRALMPVQQGSVAYADIRARCAIVSNALSGQAACP